MKGSWAKVTRVFIILGILVAASSLQFVPFGLPSVLAQPDVGSAAPSKNWGPFRGTEGDVQINVNRTGIAVRVEVPREFLSTVYAENYTHFVQTDIRNDYYYINTVDEAGHWTYGWKGEPSDGACYKPDFSLHDPNAPWCVEIWNYLNGSFLNFTLPKFVRLKNLDAPSIAGIYNFTLIVANKTNSIGYPDFVHAWNTTLFVPVSLSDNPGAITGSICDDDDPSLTCPTILTKGVVYARDAGTGQLMARAFVNQRTGRFNLTGLAPGTYNVTASAGVFNGMAYSVSTSLMVVVYKGQVASVDSIHLSRAPQVCGTIVYRNSLDPVQTDFLDHSLSDHPYLPSLGFGVLNITVEASDSKGHVFRFMNVSADQASDSFKILTGNGTKYAGDDPYGTEFAGLPPPPTGNAYLLTVKVWISGYLQRSVEIVPVDHAPGRSASVQCIHVPIDPVVMETGGVISGTLEFWNQLGPETPFQAEKLVGTRLVTDSLFGGNVLVQAYDGTGIMRGVSVINGTRPDGKVTYANSTTLRFYVFGFSELYNRTWSGVWTQKDYGLLEEVSGYTLRVSVRGYEQQTPQAKVVLARGGNTTVNVRMIRGGAIEVCTYSYNNRFGTREIQALQPWRFLNNSIPIKARVYFYEGGGTPVGYVERRMVLGVPDGVDLNFFCVVFAGQNWSLREIWFYAFEPTHIKKGAYSIKGFTLGYVQQGPAGTITDLGALSRTSLILLIGNEIDLIGPIFAEPNLFWHTPEHDHAIGEARSDVLAGAIPANLTANFLTFDMPVFGFGAMLQNITFLGQGHFFYVPQTESGCMNAGYPSDWNRCFDYGLDTGGYTAEIPEFGFNKHFTQLAPASTVDFDDLFQGESRIVFVIAMARIIQGTLPNALVTGWVDGASVAETVPLSWVTVEASNSSTPSVLVPTLDGRYDGVGALNLRAGTYNVKFSVLFYKPQTQASFQVNWNGTYPLLPPEGPLCPTAGIGGVCDPPAPSPALSPSSSTLGFASAVFTTDYRRLYLAV